jgi:hypothetical protein
MKKFLLFAFMLCSFYAFSQKTSGIVKGNLEDGTAATKQALEDATVSIMSAKDSSLVSFTLTSNSGYFEIKNLEPGDYYLIVSYQGFQTLKKSFSITAAKPVADLASVKMDKVYKSLGEVVVTDVSPIKVKGDTVEFNAGSFKTKPNASVEDLLKKLPGVQVDKDGNVKAQGEDVQKVYVDGKEFFGTDPKLATKNLSADMVESVQVYDDMSDQAKFTKIDDGSRSKAINIKLKKDKKHGIFGKAMAGYGTDDRYDATLSVNKFNGNQQVSLIGAANNVNKQGFSFSDVITSMGGFGGMSRMAGGGGGFGGGGVSMGTRTGGGGVNIPGISAGNNGISTSLSTGVNYRDMWGSKIDVSGSVFFSNTENNKYQNAFTQYLKNVDSTSVSQSSNTSKNRNVRINFRAEYRLDSMNSLLYTPNITFQHSEGVSADTLTNMGHYGGSPYLAVTAQSFNESNRDGYSINQNLLWRHRFQKAGRTFTLGWNNTINNSNGNGSIYAPTTGYNWQGGKSYSLQDQNSFQDTHNNNNVFSSSYTEPLGRNKIVELNYAHSKNYSTSDKETYDFNPSSGKYDAVSVIQTNKFDNTYISDRLGANFRMQQRKYNFQLGMGVQYGQQKSETSRLGKDTLLKQSYKNLFPTASFNYNFARSKNLRFNYRGRTNQPSVSQLQDVPDYSSALQITTGNPGLKQEFINSFNLGYNTFNMISFKYWAANINFSQTSNKIVNSVDTIFKRQITRPVNMNGSYTASGFFSLGMPFKGKLKGSSMNFNTVGLLNRNASMLYKEVSYNTTSVLTQTIGINYNRKEKLDIGLNGSASYTNVDYSIQKSQNTDYLSQTYSLDASYIFKYNFILSSDFDYFVTSGYSEGYNQHVPMWNASFAKQFMKAKQLEIKVSVNDILNQNQSFNRSTNDYSITDVNSNVLKRYFLLSVTYNINRMAGKNMFQMPRMIEKQMHNMRIE